MSSLRERKKKINVVTMTLVKADPIAKAKKMTFKYAQSDNFFNLRKINKKRLHSDLNPGRAIQKYAMERDNRLIGFRTKHKDKRSSLN
jgi:hypothetical protein